MNHTDTLKRITRDDTEHGVKYYRADEVDAIRAEQPAQHQEPAAWAKDTGKKLRITHMNMSGEEGWRPLVYCDPSPQPAQQEPVAWMYDQAKYRENDLRGRQWAFNCFSQNKPWADYMVRNLTPLYTSPPAQRKPLTDEEKLMCWSRATHDADVEHKTEHQCLMDYGTEIEAKHGIKEQP